MLNRKKFKISRAIDKKNAQIIFHARLQKSEKARKALRFYTVRSKQKKRTHAFIKAIDKKNLILAEKIICQGVDFKYSLFWAHKSWILGEELYGRVLDSCFRRLILNKDEINIILIDSTIFGDTACTRVAIKYGADVNFDGERPALFWPIVDLNLEMTKSLISAGANINYLVDGESFLHHLINSDCQGCSKCIAMTNLLINSGIDVNVTDSNGKTALDYAMDLEKKDIIQIFKEKSKSLRDADIDKIADRVIKKYEPVLRKLSKT